MWELDYKESWALKNWYFWTVVLKKTLESPLDCKEIQPVHSLGDQSWVFFGRNDAKTETPVLWPPHAKNWLNGKDPDAGEDLRWEEKGTMEDEMVGWHHQLNGHGFGWTPGIGDGKGGLACCDHGVAKGWTRLKRLSSSSSSFNISPSNECSGLISFRMDWLDLLAVQGTLKSLLQHHSSKASILWHSAFFYSPTLTSIHDYWKEHSFD